MLIPIGHENMSARRWPVVTLALIALNTIAFIATHSSIQQQESELNQVEAHVLLLSASHPDLTTTPEVQQFVSSFREHEPDIWKELENPHRKTIDDWDAKTRKLDDAFQLQGEMDSLGRQYSELESSALTEKYAFVPAHPTAISYLTANFLHGGWLHLIGNMWFLWLAGFVLEDAWGRPLYTVAYLIAGVAALQIQALANAGSFVPTLGASGAVAALMGAFLVRFPKMRINMMWLFSFRAYRFQAPAYTLLPLWLLMEVFYGSLGTNSGGVAHWAHIGGFLFGMGAAALLHYTGLEQTANKEIEEKITLKADAEISQAGDQLQAGQVDEAIATLTAYVAARADSMDGYNLLQQAYLRKGDVPKYQEAITRLCQLHLKNRYNDAAWQDYEDFIQVGGKTMPAATWLELCKVAEGMQAYERALSEYDKLAATYPTERQAIMAQLSAGRICVSRLNRPQDGLRYYEAAAKSPVPHLDLEANIEAGLREAKAAMAPTGAATVAARA